MPAVASDPSLQATRSRLLADKVIAITGASSEIGADAARVLAREGVAVVLGGGPVIGLSRSVARDYGTHGLRINAIAPGTTPTPMIAAWRQCDPSIEERLNAATPLGRGPPRSPTPPRGCSATAPPT